MGGRWSWRSWAFLLATAVLGATAHAGNVTWPTMPTWTSALSNLSSTFTLLPSGLAIWAAWASSRHRRWQVDQALPVRANLAVVVDWYLPALVVSVVAPLITALVIGTQLVGPIQAIELLTIATTSATLLSWTLFGAALGRFIPQVIAAPFAGLTALVAVAYPAGLGDMAIRHVLGYHPTCCLLEDRVPWPVVVVPFVFQSVAALAWLFVLSRATWLRAVAAVAVIAVTFVGLHTVMTPNVDPDGVVIRPRSELHCSGQRPIVCLWPEQEPERAAIQSVAHRVHQASATAGVASTPTLSSYPDTAWTYQGGLTADTLTIRDSVVIGYVSVPFPACAHTQLWRMPEVFEAMATWLSIQAGLLAPTANEARPIQPILQRPVEQQRAWFASNFEKRSQCGVEPSR